MALAIKFSRLPGQTLFKSKACLYNAIKCYSDDKPLPWNYLWRPKNYSEKDHDKIASKYHLHPKDYKPYSPDEGFYTGDYPKLPMVGPAAKDPYYPYDIPAYKKNYHEPVHYMFEIMGEDRHAYGVPQRYDMRLGTAIFIATVIVLGVLSYIGHCYPVFQPRMEQQYPQEDKVHYTFEPVK